jgi:DNA-binding NtrC family response regulator
MVRGHAILVVDDDETIRGFLQDLLSANGHEVEAVPDARTAAEMLKSREFELVLTDLMLPDGDGLEVLRIARARPYEPEVLVITAYGTIDSAVEAVRAGAFDYLTKPIAAQKLLLTVDRAIERRTLRGEVTNLRREVGERYAAEGLVAASPGMRRVLELVDTVSATDSAILIQGESGTGKELVAMIYFDKPTQAKLVDGIFARAIKAPIHRRKKDPARVTKDARAIAKKGPVIRVMVRTGGAEDRAHDASR